MHIFRPWQKHLQSFKKFGIKLLEELRPQVTHVIVSQLKKNKVEKKQKVEKR